MSEKKYTYFVSFFFKPILVSGLVFADQFSFGNGIFNLNQPINTAKALMGLEKKIGNELQGEATLISFQEIPAPSESIYDQIEIHDRVTVIRKGDPV